MHMCVLMYNLMYTFARAHNMERVCAQVYVRIHACADARAYKCTYIHEHVYVHEVHNVLLHANVHVPEHVHVIVL